MICNGLSGSPAICILSPYLRGANFDINHWRTLVHPNQSRSGDNRHKGRLFGTSLRASRCAVVRVGRIDMKFALAAATAALLLTAQTVTADAKGCIKGCACRRGGGPHGRSRQDGCGGRVCCRTSQREQKAEATARATERVKPLIKTLSSKRWPGLAPGIFCVSSANSWISGRVVLGN